MEYGNISPRKKVTSKNWLPDGVMKLTYLVERKTALGRVDNRQRHGARDAFSNAEDVGAAFTVGF